MKKQSVVDIWHELWVQCGGSSRGNIIVEHDYHILETIRLLQRIPKEKFCMSSFITRDLWVAIPPNVNVADGMSVDAALKCDGVAGCVGAWTCTLPSFPYSSSVKSFHSSCPGVSIQDDAVARESVHKRVPTLIVALSQYWGVSIKKTLAICGYIEHRVYGDSGLQANPIYEGITADNVSTITRKMVIKVLKKILKKRIKKRMSQFAV